MTDLNESRAPYLQLADDLRSEISSGKFAPGEKLPSGRELARQYGVALMTVSHAIAVLQGEGIVVSHTGRGVFVVNDRKQDSAGESRDSTIEALRADLDRLAARVSDLERRTPRNPG